MSSSFCLWFPLAACGRPAGRSRESGEQSGLVGSSRDPLGLVGTGWEQLIPVPTLSSQFRPVPLVRDNQDWVIAAGSGHPGLAEKIKYYSWVRKIHPSKKQKVEIEKGELYVGVNAHLYMRSVLDPPPFLANPYDLIRKKLFGGYRRNLGKMALRPVIRDGVVEFDEPVDSECASVVVVGERLYRLHCLVQPVFEVVVPEGGD